MACLQPHTIISRAKPKEILHPIFPLTCLVPFETREGIRTCSTEIACRQTSDEYLIRLLRVLNKYIGQNYMLILPRSHEDTMCFY